MFTCLYFTEKNLVTLDTTLKVVHSYMESSCRHLNYDLMMYAHSLTDCSLASLDEEKVSKWRKYMQFKIDIYYAYVCICMIDRMKEKLKFNYRLYLHIPRNDFTISAFV